MQKKLKLLLKLLRLNLLPRKKPLRRRSKRKSLLLNLPNKQQKKPKPRSWLLNRKLPNGRKKPKNKKQNLKLKLLLPKLLLRKDKQNLRLREKDKRLNMMPHSKLRLRLIESPILLLKLLIKLKKRREEREKKSKLLSIRDKWLPEDLHSKKHSEMCGPQDQQVFQ